MDSPVCSECKATSSLMWHKNEDGSILCLECRSNENAASEGHTPATKKDAKENSNGSHSSEACETVPQNGGASGVAANNNGSNNQGRRTRLRERAVRGKQTTRGSDARTKGGGGGNAPQPAQGTSSVSSSGNGGGKTQSQQHRATNSGSRRRQLKQAKPQRAPRPRTTIITSDSVLHKVRTDTNYWHPVLRVLLDANATLL